jgi:phage baseplate assembly protein W
VKQYKHEQTKRKETDSRLQNFLKDDEKPAWNLALSSFSIAIIAKHEPRKRHRTR